METQKTIIQLHEEHKTWLNKLAFYKDESTIMKRRIEEIASKNTAKEVLAFVEHFQNQLIIRNEEMDILSHEIREHEAFLERKAEHNPAVDRARFHDHPLHRERMEAFEHDFNALRKELMEFLFKWM